jgi:ketosteroid isomerase-like protein
MTTGSATVNLCIALINEHKVEELLLLMTDDHLFIDAQGSVVRGKSNLRRGWFVYFQMFPDYEIEVTEIIDNGELIAVFGFAS